MLKQFIPPAVRKTLKETYQNLVDTTEGVLTGRNPMVPPRSKVFVGAGEFVAVGEGFRQHFIEQGELKPHEAVLDVGCGIGRMAFPLTSYLTPPGSYEGFDIVKSGVDWCQNQITSRFPHFRFQQADILNGHYNPQGRYPAVEYRFPYEDNRFDFVFLTSVFTHMPPAEVTHYVAEIARVLKPGGRIFGTFFLLNDESRQLMTQPGATFNFRHELAGRYVFDLNDPDVGTAFDEPWVMALLDRHGLSANRDVYPGYWSGRQNTVSFQDIVVAAKA